MRAYFFQGLFRADLLGSVVVFLAALPLCMGIAVASGLPPAAGLITGIVGGIVAGALTGSPLLVSGPTAGQAVLVLELIREHGIAALGPAILLAGLLQVMAGIGKIGGWFRLLSPAVVVGVLSGIGILIVAAQLHVLVELPPRARGLENLAALPSALLGAFQGKAGNTVSLLVGLSTIAMMLAWKKFRPPAARFVPGALVAVVIVTASVSMLGMPVRKVDMPAHLLTAVAFPSWDSLALLTQPSLWVIAFAFALVASTETLLSAAAVDRMHNGVRTDCNRELTAQGVGNMLCGLLGALPMAGAIVRSAVNAQAGSGTRMATILHGIWILLFAALLPWLIRMTPVACLAGVLLYTGMKMIHVKHIKALTEYGRENFVVYAGTTLAIVVSDLLTGMLIGCALSGLKLTLSSARFKEWLTEQRRRVWSG